MRHNLHASIRTPEDLGVAHPGSPYTAIVLPKRPIDRADYGRKLAKAEGASLRLSDILSRRNYDAT